MKVIIFSDSHGSVECMCQAVRFEQPDMMIHLGDLESDAMKLGKTFPDIPLYNVVGNCDFMTLGTDRFMLPVGKRLIFAAHGHKYNVKTGYANIINTAMSAGADIVLFGHTHVPYEDEIDGVIIANPGCVSKGSKTYGVLTINNADASYERKYVENIK